MQLDILALPFDTPAIYFGIPGLQLDIPALRLDAQDLHVDIPAVCTMSFYWRLLVNRKLPKNRCTLTKTKGALKFTALAVIDTSCSWLSANQAKKGAASTGATCVETWSKCCKWIFSWRT
eukprot:gnl/TRDRNA2_/TRDRNA2_168727_c0_seq4.p1 gnl/TRDRNA2_/TRDRNA2_168727_c0~~gnl/TRDRNA2_/TRDRNA2_168727_c0_seq4.p1  ORF type:complete len:120 (+),score=2.34 gnl/TRDRNA2_/TRDRNA2_168727_c0_seq4:195-554(+)